MHHHRGVTQIISKKPIDRVSCNENLASICCDVVAYRLQSMYVYDRNVSHTVVLNVLSSKLLDSEKSLNA